MHEMGLIRDLLHKIEQIAAEQNARRIAKVDVWLGALAHISPDHFREHFVEGIQGSLAEGADLEIELSGDIHHPQAQDILLKSIDVT
jgi:hydrogenase nickel incorporation protein HypA/HybF